MAKPQELPDGEEPQEATPASRPTVRPLFASSNTKDLDEVSDHDEVAVGFTGSEKEIHLVESYFPGMTDIDPAVRRTLQSERSDRFSALSVQRSGVADHESMKHALPPLLVFFACLIAGFLGLVVAGLHDMIKYVGCPLGINGCNSFSGESYEKKAYVLLTALEDYVPEDVVFIVMAIACNLLIGLIADVVPESYQKQILGGGTVQSLLAVAAGVPIPFKCALLRVVIMALYFLGGGTMGGDGPTIQVCTSLACMIGWVCGIRAPRTQSLLASLGFCCGFASSFNAPLSGILFAMEELSHVSSRLTTRVICIILIGSIVSTAVMRGFLTNKTLFKATHDSNLEDMVAGGSINGVLGQDMWMSISILIGFVAALVGFLFSIAFEYVHRFVSWLQTWLPKWLIFGIVGGLVASIGSAVYRATGLRGVWGIGVNSLKKALDQDFEGHAGYLLIYTVGKLLAFNLSVSARFPGDTLEPVLIAGAFLGGAIGKHLPASVVGESNSPCVIFGMVGLFASCFRFPLTPVVIVLELTGTRTYNLILPVALSSFTANAVSNHLFPPILEQILHQDNIDLEAVAELAELAEEEELIMQQLQMQRMSSAQSMSMSEASNISVASKRSGAFGGLVNRLEDSMMDVSSRKRRASLMSMASSRSGGRTYGRGIRRLSMNSRMSGVSRHSGLSTNQSRSPTTGSPRHRKRQSFQENLSDELSPKAVIPELLETIPVDSDDAVEDEIPPDQPGPLAAAAEMEEVNGDAPTGACCEPFST